MCSLHEYRFHSANDLITVQKAHHFCFNGQPQSLPGMSSKPHPVPTQAVFIRANSRVSATGGSWAKSPAKMTLIPPKADVFPLASERASLIFSKKHLATCSVSLAFVRVLLLLLAFRWFIDNALCSVILPIFLAATPVYAHKRRRRDWFFL